MPIAPIRMRSFAETGLRDAASAAAAPNTSRAYHNGSPHPTSPATERCIKPRRERLPRSIVELPWYGCVSALKAPKCYSVYPTGYKEAVSKKGTVPFGLHRAHEFSSSEGDCPLF